MKLFNQLLHYYFLFRSDPREEIVWTGLLDYPNTLHFNCEFSLVKNKLGAAELQKILPAIMKIQGYIDSDTVWAYLDSLRNAWNKEVITLLMHPPIGMLFTRFKYVYIFYFR